MNLHKVETESQTWKANLELSKDKARKRGVN